MKSPLQPGIDGNCAAILYMCNNRPSWVMLPCGQQVTRYLICTKKPRVHNAIQKLGYPLFWCRGLCLLVCNACYGYKLLQTNSNSSIVCSIDNAYLFHLNKNFANHGIDVHFLWIAQLASYARKVIQVNCNLKSAKLTNNWLK